MSRLNLQKNQKLIGLLKCGTNVRWKVWTNVPSCMPGHTVTSWMYYKLCLFTHEICNWICVFFFFLLGYQCRVKSPLCIKVRQRLSKRSVAAIKHPSFTAQGRREPDPHPACTGQEVGKRKHFRNKGPRSKCATVRVLDGDACRCQPTLTCIKCCQVARRSDRWYWYFALANHKTRTQQGGSVFAQMIPQPEWPVGSGSHVVSGAAL